MVIDSAPMAHKMRADLVVEAAAQQLRQLLKEAASLLDPFPPFPGSFFTLGIEVEGGMSESVERGCVVLASDGELYELAISIDAELGHSDPMAARDEKLRPLDLHPRDYIVYAYNALSRVTELLMERRAGS